MAAARLLRGQLLEARPLLGEEVAGVVDALRRLHGAGERSGREHDRDTDRCPPARSRRHGDPAVDECIDGAGNEADQEEDERDRARVPGRRVGAVGAEARGQPAVARHDQGNHDRGR